MLLKVVTLDRHTTELEFELAMLFHLTSATINCIIPSLISVFDAVHISLIQTLSHLFFLDTLTSDEVYLAIHFCPHTHTYHSCKRAPFVSMID